MEKDGIGSVGGAGGGPAGGVEIRSWAKIGPSAMEKCSVSCSTSQTSAKRERAQPL